MFVIIISKGNMPTDVCEVVCSLIISIYILFAFLVTPGSRHCRPDRCMTKHNYIGLAEDVKVVIVG